jgi:hypothetical protein
LAYLVVIKDNFLIKINFFKEKRVMKEDEWMIFSIFRWEIDKFRMPIGLFGR